MRRLYALALAAVTLLFEPTTLWPQTTEALAQAPAPSRYADAIAHARLLAQAITEESRTPGLSVAVGVDGEIVWSEGFGYASVEQRTPVWEETKFRIGSISKPLTAAALALLYEQGRLDLDAPVQRYVPTFPEKRWPVTTRQLAGHLAGIRHYRNQEFLSSRRYATVLEGLEIFQDDTLLFEPGTRYSYSSYGWNLLSAVVEGASGESFLSYMQRQVFERLGMKHTVADHTDSIIPHRTEFYDRDDNRRVLNAPFVDNSYKWAGGGFLSTPEDLVRFAMAHLDEGFLKRETVELLWTSQRNNAGVETGYGIGWSVHTDREGRRTVSHGGGSMGGTAFLLIFPEQRVVVATVGNMSQAPNGYTPAWLIAQPFLKPSEAPAMSASGPSIAGSYQCTAKAGGEVVANARLELAGSPGDYWGRFVSDNKTTDRVIYSSSRGDTTRIISVDQFGRLTESWLAVNGSQASGGWFAGRRSGELGCRLERR